MNCKDNNKWFQTAQPIWLKDLENEQNITMGCRAEISFAKDSDNVQLLVAASNIYRLTVNGEFINHGPARGPHGYYRVDVIKLNELLKKEQNIITIEVVGYNENSYYLLDQMPFLQAEIIYNGKVIVSTAGEGQHFEIFRITDRIQRTQRYSFQRPNSEAYSLKEGYDLWKKDSTKSVSLDSYSIQEEKAFLPRRIPFADFFCRMPLMEISSGNFETISIDEPLWRDRSILNVGPALKGFKENELEINPSFEVQKTKTTETNEKMRFTNGPVSLARSSA